MPSLAFRYLEARSEVVESGFADEIAWQANRSVDQVCEQSFLRECAWVILSSGMRESVIRAKFDAFSRAFSRWHSAKRIVNTSNSCRTRAATVFSHSGKIEAILTIANFINDEGFDPIRTHLMRSDVEFFMQFPFLGPATAYHLLKNLGADVVKPDRHLIRASCAAGFECPTAFCTAIAEEVRDRLSVIDLVVWRFATLNPAYARFFAHSNKC